MTWMQIIQAKWILQVEKEFYLIIIEFVAAAMNKEKVLSKKRLE